MKLTNSKLKKRVDALMEDFYKNDNENTLEILKMESERLLSVTEYPKAHIALALYYSKSNSSFRLNFFVNTGNLLSKLHSFNSLSVIFLKSRLSSFNSLFSPLLTK